MPHPSQKCGSCSPNLVEFIIYSDRSEPDLSDETIRIKNFPFSRKLWKNCWKWLKLQQTRFGNRYVCVLHDTGAVWKNYQKKAQAFSCPRDWRFSASYGDLVEGPLEHHSTIVLKVTLNWAPLCQEAPASRTTDAIFSSGTVAEVVHVWRSVEHETSNQYFDRASTATWYRNQYWFRCHVAVLALSYLVWDRYSTATWNLNQYTEVLVLVSVSGSGTGPVLV